MEEENKSSHIPSQAEPTETQRSFDEPILQNAPDLSPIADEETATAKPSRSPKWYILGTLCVIFLAAAVFFGARMLKPKMSSGVMEQGGIFVSSGGPGGAKSIRVDMTPASELPKDQPITAGLFVRREDQSLFIGTGNVQMVAKRSDSGSSPDDISSSYDGPVVEVVITHDTQVYQDITEMMPPEDSQSDTLTIQQMVKPGSVDDLGQNTMLTVWGEKQGDRIIAKVITFR